MVQGHRNEDFPSQVCGDLVQIMFKKDETAEGTERSINPAKDTIQLVKQTQC